jgi:HlyD family secretion protein
MAAKQSGGWLKWIIIFLIVGAVVAAGGWYLTHGKSDAPQYQAVTVGRAELTQVVTATGTLNPVVNVTVGSQVSGRISKLNVDYNSVVKSNEVIAEIDPATYQASVKQVEADLASAKANLELQKAEADRSAELFTNNLVSGSDYDTAVANLHEAEATVQQKQASLDNAKVNLAYCKILSPVDGVVILRAVELGQTVASSFNTPTIFQIANDLTKMQIDSNVAEADVGGIEEGQDVSFTVDAYPYRTFRGTVVQVRNSPTTVNNVVTYDCVIGVTNADYKLKPGMTANASVIIAQREDALTIPNSALRFRPPDAALPPASTNAPATQTAPNTNGEPRRGQGGGQGRRGGGNGGRPHGERPVIHTVYVLSSDEKNPTLKPVQIKTGISDGISTEVLSGLNEGDRVVTGMVTTSGSATPAATSNPFGGGGGGRRF